MKKIPLRLHNKQEQSWDLSPDSFFPVISLNRTTQPPLCLPVIQTSKINSGQNIKAGGSTSGF